MSHSTKNALAKETSPYLLQHAYNPVNWVAWSQEAFKTAQQENKLVLVSIGYSACHWCHVMEHESFENEEIAKIMNDHFICIKVDREERPDVDQVYMQAVQMITGQGGWPLNCFTLPDGRPIYGGTYFRPQDWKQVLLGLNQTYLNESDRILRAANELTQGMEGSNLNFSTEQSSIDDAILETAIDKYEKNFDANWGGMSGAPKFPMPANLDLLMHHNFYENKDSISQHLRITLDAMANGGIYDHVEGGFARYSVDKKWQVPHFEKMLYDNGQLVSIYSKAYKQTKSLKYKNIVEQTLQFVTHNLSNSKGAFYASFDADSEGVEGKYYIWSKKELVELLGNDATWFVDFFDVHEEGNWEGSNVLWLPKFQNKLETHSWSLAEFYRRISKPMELLLEKRKQRIAPALDNKILSSWNALMSLGFIDAYEAFENQGYLDMAIKNAEFIRTELLQESGELLHSFSENGREIRGFLDDYALVIKLFLKLYQVSFKQKWLDLANQLINLVKINFYDKNTGLYYYTHQEQTDLIIRKIDTIDHVIPSSNSVMANNLFDYGQLISNSEYIKQSEKMLSAILPMLKENPIYHSHWLSLFIKITKPNYELALIGAEAEKLNKQLSTHYLPHVLIAGCSSDNSNLKLLKNRFKQDKTLIYCCVGNSCKLPLETVEAVLKEVEA